MANTASAQAADPVAFDIPSQALSAALTQFAQQSKAEILFSSHLARDQRAPAVQGEMAASEALGMLLAQSGLSYRVTPTGSFVIETADPQSGSAAGDGADGTVEALIVTAQKREEDIQDVPIAISAFTQEDLTRSQVAGGPDLMTQVPNMTFTKTNFSSYSIQIRGIGTQAISATTDPAVAVAFNNTPFVRNHFFEQEFYDLQRVEVLRGPQGTLYGRNATAGVVNVISAKAALDRFEAKVSADVANYASTRLEGMINIPLVEDRAALRIAGAWTKRDGFVKNILTGDQTDGRDLWSGRVTLSLEPTDWMRADLIYEHFEEDDDRLRSGKQMCTRDPGPAMVGDKPVPPQSYVLAVGVNYLSQGCLPSSLYSPDAFQTPNGYTLAYYGALSALGSPVTFADPYESTFQSRDLREIETRIEPDYEASADVVELQLSFDVSDSLTLASETGYERDYIFSWQDFNRFNTKPGAFAPDAPGTEFPKVHPDGTFCDPQIGCTDRLSAADLATARSQQFSQEFRLSSDFEGPFNFNLGANFLRYDTEDKYYVFINSLTVWAAQTPWIPGASDNRALIEGGPADIGPGYIWASPDRVYGLGSEYIDPGDVHNLNDQGRNYFLSKNPYRLVSYAAFGEGYYELSPQLKVTAGLRWTVDKKTAPVLPSWLLAGGTYGTATRKVIKEEWREPTGRLAIDWQPDLGFTDETLVYASYVRGYKAGGANPPPPVVVWPPVGITEGFLDILVNQSVTHPERFDAEYVNAYEVGSKNTLLDGRLTFNLGAFYYDYTGYQISQIVNRSAVNLNFDAEVWGAELEADWRPLENLRFGLKVGYEKTRMADGSKAVDLMDRTAGQPGWVVFKPFPPQASNCIIPEWLAEVATSTYMTGMCGGYLAGVDPFTNMAYVPDPQYGRDGANGTLYPINELPVGGADLTGYPGFNPASAPNNGEGFFKDLSGNELPNAPDYTVTLTGDYTLPLPNSWLMTLHTDLYYQSEAWTRVFNTEGYDKLKAYTNVNFAAIFTNEDAGWNVMAYVKNVMDRDSITGAFLNSDDTGLSTNVFLTEPRLYGLRVTKSWSGMGGWGGFGAGPNVYQPFRVEFGGLYGPFGHGHEPFAPAGVALSQDDQPYPLGVQDQYDWGGAGGVGITYQPVEGGWFARGGVRYGRANGSAEAHPQWEIAGGLFFGPESYQVLSDLLGVPIEVIEEQAGGKYFDPTEQNVFEYATTTSTNEESFAVADFAVGRDVGLGMFDESKLSLGLRYAKMKSSNVVAMHGRPQVIVPEEEIAKYGIHLNRFHANVDMGRSFEGVGPSVQWEGTFPLLGDRKSAGGVGVDAGVGGVALWGRQKVDIQGEVHGDDSIRSRSPFEGGPTTDAYALPVSIQRSKSVVVPGFSANLGLSYAVGGFKVSGGYRLERYFEAIDGGVAQRKTFDRSYDGPYFKVSIGFGG